MTKKWYASVGVWVGVCTFLIGALEVVAEFLKNGDFSSFAIVVTMMGVIKVLERVMRSNSTITL